MNVTEAGTLLAHISAYDNRNFNEFVAVTWHGIVGRYQFEEARQAVDEHFSTSTEYLLPAHLIRLIKSKRRFRLTHFDAIDPNRTDGADIATELAVRRQLTEAVATGQMDQRMYDDYHRSEQPWSEYRSSVGILQSVPSRPKPSTTNQPPTGVESIVSTIGKKKSL